MVCGHPLPPPPLQPSSSALVSRQEWPSEESYIQKAQAAGTVGAVDATVRHISIASGDSAVNGQFSLAILHEHIECEIQARRDDTSLLRRQLKQAREELKDEVRKSAEATLAEVQSLAQLLKRENGARGDEGHSGSRQPHLASECELQPRVQALEQQLAKTKAMLTLQLTDLRRDVARRLLEMEQQLELKFSAVESEATLTTAPTPRVPLHAAAVSSGAGTPTVAGGAGHNSCELPQAVPAQSASRSSSMVTVPSGPAVSRSHASLSEAAFRMFGRPASPTRTLTDCAEAEEVKLAGSEEPSPPSKPRPSRGSPPDRPVGGGVKPASKSKIRAPTPLPEADPAPAQGVPASPAAPQETESRAKPEPLQSPTSFSSSSPTASIHPRVVEGSSTPIWVVAPRHPGLAGATQSPRGSFSMQAPIMVSPRTLVKSPPGQAVSVPGLRVVSPQLVSREAWPSSGSVTPLTPLTSLVPTTSAPGALAMAALAFQSQVSGSLTPISPQLSVVSRNKTGDTLVASSASTKDAFPI